MIRQILKHKNQFWLLVAIAVGFALRIYALDAQSLWNDEGTSVALSQLSLEAITYAAARDIHPPLYYYLLHFWMPLVGQSEFAARFLSVIAGVLTVAVTFRITYVFFDEEVAIIAAFFSAFSSFQIYYSQEARMYIGVTLFATISVYAMTQMLRRAEQVKSPESETLAPHVAVRTTHSHVGVGIRQSQIENPISILQPPISNSRTKRSLFWLLYVAATIAMLYTQYVGAFVVIAENLAFAVWFVLAWRDTRLTIWHSVAFWVVAQLIVGLAFLPWYLFAGNQLAMWPSISEPFDLLTLLWRVLNVFSVGTTLDAGTALPIALAFGVLFFIGWRQTRDAHVNWVIATLILWTLVPVGAMYVVSLSRPAYNPKFLLLATPEFFILCARGLSEIHPGIFLHHREGHAARWIGNPLVWVLWIISVLAAVGFVPSLRNYYFDPQYARDDYRLIVKFIDTNARDGDGILVDAPGQIDVVRYYRRGDQQLFLLPRMRPADPAATRTDVDEMLGKVKRLFAIYYATHQSDPQGIIETRLAERAFKARDEWHGDVRLVVYGIAPAERGAMNAVNVQVGDELALGGFRLDGAQARVGDILTLTLGWRVVLAPSARYKVFVHLLDANDQVIAQRDGEPVGDTRITTTWRAGESFADNYGIFIESGTPPGEYRIEIGMYRADNGARLPITAPDGRSVGDRLIVGTVVVK